MNRTQGWLLLLAAIAATVLFDILFVFYILPNTAYWTIFAPVYAAGLLGALFLPKFRLDTVAAPASTVSSQLARRLRFDRYRVEEGPQYLAVRLGWLSALKVWVASVDGKARIRYQLDATTGGWAVVMLLIIILEASVVAPIAMFNVYVRVQSFVERKLRPLLASGQVTRETPPEEIIQATLADSLSEAYRLAAEAYESERSTHQDSQLLVAAGAILVWALFPVILFFGLPTLGIRPLGSDAFLYATVLAASLGAIASWAVYRRFNPRIREYHGWSERLRRALAAETSRTGVPGVPSVFELLSDASGQVPVWVEARRRAGLAGDPAAGLLVGGMAIWSFTAFGVAYASIGLGLPIAILLASGGVLLSVLLFAFYRRWARRWDAAARRALADWTRRLERLRSVMETFLDGL